MIRHTDCDIKFSVMYIHSFSFSTQFKVEDVIFLRQHKNPQELESVADKLRWYRLTNCLLQKEVAARIGVYRTTYSHLESGLTDLYPLDKLEILAKLYRIHITDLLDEYNLFVYNDQGKQIRALRKSMNLTQYEFGKKFGANHSRVKRWETNKAIMFKSTWEKIYKS